MSMREGERIIWTSRPDYEDWREVVESELPDATDEERYEYMMAVNSDGLEFEREALAHQYPDRILVIADLGLWNGRISVYKEIPSGNLADCFVPTSDTLDITWYLDGKGNLRADDRHHDGVNHYLYRVWKPGATQRQRQSLKTAILLGRCKASDIERVTDRLGGEIEKIYAWPQYGGGTREEFER